MFQYFSTILYVHFRNSRKGKSTSGGGNPCAPHPLNKSLVFNSDIVLLPCLEELNKYICIHIIMYISGSVHSNPSIILSVTSSSIGLGGGGRNVTGVSSPRANAILECVNTPRYLCIYHIAGSIGGN